VEEKVQEEEKRLAKEEEERLTEEKAKYVTLREELCKQIEEIHFKNLVRVCLLNSFIIWG